MNLLKNAGINPYPCSTDDCLIKDVTLDVDASSIYRLIGLNGSGKSTLLETILGLKKPIYGEVALPWKVGSAKYQSSVGYLPATVNGYPNLTLDQWLTLTSQGYGIKKPHILETWGLLGGRGDFHTPLSQLSSGNRKKALFVSTILKQRAIIILDEPFEEVDISGQEAMAELIDRQKKAGAIIILVSHRSIDHLLSVDFEWAIEDNHILTHRPSPR